MRFKDKVAIITGVDAGGIGQAAALMFADAGARVVVMGAGEQDGLETVALIRKGGGNALLLNPDLARERDVKQACEDTVRAFGKLDILINNDAVPVPKGPEPAAEDWQRFKANNGSTALISRYAAEVMKRQGKGAIVNIVTLSGSRPQSTTHSTGLATLMQLAREMAVDLAPDNIRVNFVCHGAVQNVTPLENVGATNQIAEEFLAEESQKCLPNRLGKPREVAYAILFLASDEASFITGTHLLVDGGHYSTVKSSLEQHIASRVASFS